MAIYMRVGPVGGGEDTIAISGSVSQEGHYEWIELTNVDFGAIHAPEEGDVSAASVAGSGHGVSIDKDADYSTPQLIKWAVDRAVYDVQIDCCRESGKVYTSFFLEGVAITGMDSGAHLGGVNETIRFGYKKLTLRSTSFDKSGQQTEQSAASTKETEQFSRVSAAPLRSGSAGRQSGASIEGRAEVAMTAVAGTGGLDGAEAASALSGSRIGLEMADEMYDGLLSEDDSVQEDRRLSIDAISGKVFELESFEGAEELSRPFEFVLQALSKDKNIQAKDLVGKEVSFRIEDSADIADERTSEPREFHGVCREIFLGPVQESRRRYTLVVVPKLWLLQQGSNCRIFANKTINDIASEILSEYAISDYKTEHASKGSVTLEHCVQYRESDFDFLSRLWEEYGVFYSFSFAKAAHTLHLGDTKSAYRVGAPEKVKQSSGTDQERHIKGWWKRYRMTPGKMTFREYNFEEPGATLEESAKLKEAGYGNASYEVYEYPGRYAILAEGEKAANIRADQEESTRCLVEATSTCEWFVGGSTLQLEEHQDESEKNKYYAIARVRHSAKALPREGKCHIRYANRILAIPKETVFRPARKTPRPLITGPQTALVVGAAGEEIQTDEYGRVRVQFRWDRRDLKDENASCWVRVAQVAAGPGYGAMVVPRIGWEVVVEFEDGNPDRPLVTGTVYNKISKPAHALPEHKTRTVLRTQTTTDGGKQDFNELYFDDKKSEEEVFMQAQKDFNRVVKNNDTLSVGTEGVGDRTIKVQGAQSLDVVKGDRLATLQSGSDKVAIESGDQTIEVQKGDRTVTLGAGKQLIEAPKGITLKVGDNVIEILPSGIQMTVGGSTVDVKPDAIELKSGPSSIKLDPSGLRAEGMMVTLESNTAMNIKGLTCELSAEAMLKATGGIIMLG